MGFADALRVALGWIGDTGVISESQAPMNWDDYYTVSRPTHKNTPTPSYFVDVRRKPPAPLPNAAPFHLRAYNLRAMHAEYNLLMAARA